MTILFCGGEDIDFVNLRNISIITANRRADFSRCSMDVRDSSITTAATIANTIDPVLNLWLSAYYYMGGTTTTPRSVFGLVDIDNKGIIVNCGNSVTDGLQLCAYDGSIFTVLDTSPAFNSSTGYRIDLFVNYAVAGSIKLYINNVLTLEYDGDLTTFFATTGFIRPMFGAGSSFTSSFVSEVIIADEDTRLMSLKTLAPDAAGDLNQWNNDYTAIDEIILSDADVIHTDQFDQEFQCNLTGMPTGDFIVKAVKIAARAADGISGIGLQTGIKTNATVDLGDTVTLDGSWQLVEEMYQQNPITLNRFTPAEIDALQIAFKSIEIV